MEVLLYLVPLAIVLGALGLAAFLWSLRSGQYDDLDGAAWRAIADDEPAETSSTSAHPASAQHRQRDCNPREGHQQRPSGRLRSQPRQLR
ncbi:cbb3-type cytochrome oxidase assembly protein CcoS [Bradyrhizobium diazoefficiens]|nr:cbb3-type cytochrome oxidase assembly protein CcoS [Bradyrhizobium diazoefficiens]